MKNAITMGVLLAVAALVAAGCATTRNDAELHADTVAMLEASFKPLGQAQMDRLAQDETQRVCSDYFGKPLPPGISARIEQANLAAIKWPADSVYVGDWRAGEKIAQEGRGKQFSDDPAGPVGGNCYACHRLTPEEISYGTIGPSLYQFGKLRGFTDATRKYAYGKVYNAEAYAACSNMPRFGTHAILSEQQVKDVVALLMDPRSPVNQ